MKKSLSFALLLACGFVSLRGMGEWEHDGDYKSLSWDESGEYIAFRKQDNVIDVYSSSGQEIQEWNSVFSEKEEVLIGKVTGSLTNNADHELTFKDFKNDGVSFSSDKVYRICKAFGCDVKLLSEDDKQEVAAMECSERVVDVSWSPAENVVAILGCKHVLIKNIEKLIASLDKKRKSSAKKSFDPSQKKQKRPNGYQE